MKSIKKIFLQIICLAFICCANVIAHAEEVDSYYVWEIKNIDDYQSYSLMFRALNSENGIVGMRDAIYWATIYGKYSEAAVLCEVTEAQQKIAFGENYFDENLTELTAKLYMAADEFDKAERKINFLLDNTQDNSVKIRALNLQSDLYNRRGKYNDALKVTEEVHNLLQSTPDEALTLINWSRAAMALCGLNETKKSLELAEEIFPRIQSTFGNAGIETLALMSTLAEDYRKVQRYEDSGKILENKFQVVNERYGQNDPVIVSKNILELVDFCFEIKESKQGEELLNGTLDLATKCADNNNNHASLQLYKAINGTATKHLDGNNPVVLKSELGLARMQNIVGDIPQSLELCRKDLSKFKKVFGEQSDETLALMKIFGDDYLLLGKYSDAKKVADERLTICKKNFGDHDARTVESTIDLAKAYYKMGKFQTADKLLADVESQSRDILENTPTLHHDFLSAKGLGAYMTGDCPKFFQIYNATEALSEKFPPQDFIRATNRFTQLINLLKLNEDANKTSDYTIALLNLVKNFSNDYHPKILEIMNNIAESYISAGRLNDAKRFTEQVLKLSQSHFGENNFCKWLALNTLSKICRAEGNFSDALEVDKQALQVAEKVCGKNSLERLQSLDSIASDHTALGNFNEAIKIRERALSDYDKILEETDANSFQVMTNLAENYVAVKKYTDAVKLCDETLAKQKIQTYIEAEMPLTKNITELFRIEATAQKLSGDNVNANANYRRLIQVYEMKRANLNNEIFSSSENKARWFAGLIQVYRDAASVSVSEEVNNKNFAFYCTEFCKGRNLLDRYDDILISQNYLLRYFEKDTLKHYQSLLTSCRDVIDYAGTTNDDMLSSNSQMIYVMLHFNEETYKAKLRQKYSNNMVPKDPQKRAEAEQKQTSWEETLKNFDINKNRQAIPNGACFVEFMKVSDDSLLALFLRNDSDIGAANIPVDKNFFDKCRLYHDLNSYADINALHKDGKYLWRTVDGKYMITAGRTSPAPSAVAINDSAKWSDLRKELSAELSKKIIPTIEKYVGNSSYWIISPDAELNLVPFETLLYRDKMLIESVDVSYVPSLAVLNLMKKRERKNYYLGQSKELFAMGDAVYGNTDATTSRGSQLDFFDKLRSNSDDKIDITALQWSNLPGTARELDKVSPLFESKDIFRREQVTEKNLQKMNIDGDLAQYKYILFATHGLFVPDMPEVSSIVLSQEFNDEDYDGYVTVGEWMGYDLRSNLVYLSACESGLGGYQAGEGIVGIPYALTVAGNKDTVMSLWKVDDEATAEFTSAVFEKLSKGKLEVAALNETKREFLKNSNTKYNNPSVWAAFLLYGI